MSYGILIQNQDSRIQIDETFSNQYLSTTTESSAAAYSSYPPTGYVLGDFVFGRCKSSGHMARGWLASGGTTAWYSYNSSAANWFSVPSSGYGYFIGKKYAGNISSQSGYGFEVYNASSQVVYSASAKENNFNILAAGKFTNTAYSADPYEIAFPSSTGTYSDLSKIYCLMNNTAHIKLYFTLPFGGTGANDDYLSGYRYEYTSGNAGRVHICNKLYSGGTYAAGFTFDYMIIEVV